MAVYKYVGTRMVQYVPATDRPDYRTQGVITALSIQRSNIHSNYLSGQCSQDDTRHGRTRL
jgi:hypothetical protein